MTATISRVPQSVAVALVAVVLAAGISTAGFAQQRAASADSRQTRPWSIEDALPKNSSAIPARKPVVSTVTAPDLGRVPLKTGPGSFGFTADTAIKPHEYPDGRPVPGSDTHAVVRTRKPGSFLGLSLSVPTFD